MELQIEILLEWLNTYKLMLTFPKCYRGSTV